MATKFLRTTDIARAVGVHPNTVRLYEAWGFLPPIPRSRSGYRLYTERHLDQMRLARTALQAPYPGGKEPVLNLVLQAVRGNLGESLEQAYLYLANIRAETAHAEAAVAFLERWAKGISTDSTSQPLHIGGVAQLLNVTIDRLRNWERNGLIDVPRSPQNGYRLYTAIEIGRLRVIRMLRQEGYSMMAILRMLRAFDEGQRDNLRQMLDTPHHDEDVYSAADQWLTTLHAQEQRALDIIAQLETMIQRWG